MDDGQLPPQQMSPAEIDYTEAPHSLQLLRSVAPFIFTARLAYLLELAWLATLAAKLGWKVSIVPIGSSRQWQLFSLTLHGVVVVLVVLSLLHILVPLVRRRRLEGRAELSPMARTTVWLAGAFGAISSWACIFFCYALYSPGR